MKQINFDQQSGSTLAPEVWESMLPFLRLGHHPASLHQRGIRARAALEQARVEVAKLIGATHPEEIFFTNSRIEALDWALQGLAPSPQRHPEILLSAIESRADVAAVSRFQARGYQRVLFPVGPHGEINIQALETQFTNQTGILLTHWVNEEVGTVQPIQEIATYCTSKNLPLVINASAALGWLSIDLSNVPVSALSLSSERFGGPQGVAALYLRRTAGSSAVKEEIPACDNLAGIVGLGTATRLAREQLAGRQERVHRVQRLIGDFVSSQMNDVHLLGPPIGPHRVGYHLNLAAVGAEGEALALKLDLQGFAVATHPVCVLRNQRHSHVHQALGIPSKLSSSSILLTLPSEIDAEDLHRFCLAYQKSVNQLRSMG